jgi:putative DNA primase/helicase
VIVKEPHGRLSEIEIIAQFTDAMCDEGIGPAGYETIVASGKLERYDVVGDKRKSGNGWYILHADRFPNGTFGCNKRYGTDHAFTWKPEQQSAPMSADERKQLDQEMRARQAARDAKSKKDREHVAALADEIWKKAKAQGKDWDGEHPYLDDKGIKASGARIGDFPVFDKDTGEVIRTYRGALLIQIRDFGKTNNTRSLQAIRARPGEDGGFQKLFLTGGAKRGNFFPIGQPKKNADGHLVFIVAEGFATGASIYEATGQAVVVAFDSANLQPVGEAIRAKFADAVILFAADNDQFTVTPINNPGVHHATKAAHAVGGLVAVPEFGDLDGKPTDFNDLHAREGLADVEACINAVLYPPDKQEQAEDLPWDALDQLPPEAREVPRSKPVTQAEAEDQAVHEVEEQAGFRILGHQRDKVFIFVHGMKQIIERETFPLTTLLHMAPLNWWENNFPGKGNGGSVNFNQAAEFIIRTAQRRGLYDPNCVRNGGAWSDAGRHVFHHGNHLTVDGVRMLVTAIRSRFVYEQTLPLPTPADVALTDAEGRHIFDIAKRFNWERSSSAALLAGWTFLAPICGALKWRPHLFLTGPAGNGKSTILRDYVHTLIGEGGCVYAQGSSTEAGVRQDIGSTSLPCLIDEAERNTEREQQRIEALLALIRQSSTESAAKTLKGTVGGEGMKFNVRSMFCLAAIFTGLERKADIDRLSVLSLKPSRCDVAAADRWEGTKELLHKLGNEDGNLRGKMMRRALDMMPTILANIEVFKKVATDKFGSARDGDQFGTMLAGAWSLTNSAIATPEQAREMMDGLDWTDYAEASEADDSESALQELMGAFIQVQGIRHTVHNLINFALGEEVEGRTLDSRQARTELRQHGIVLEGTKLILSNNVRAIKKLLADTPFATDPGAAFGRLPGAGKHDGKKVRFSGMRTRVTTLPLEAIGFGGKNITSEDDLL